MASFSGRNQVFAHVGDLDLAPVLVVVDGGAQNLLGNRQRLVLVKLDMRRTLDLDFGRGGDHFGVKIPRQLDQCLHDTLHVDHHRLNRAGQDRQFLLEEITRRRDTLAHQDFVSRAANPGQVDAVRARRPRVFDDLRVLRRRHDHLAEGGFVAVHDHVDHVVFEHAQIRLAQDRGWRAEQDVGDVGRDHAAAPSIRQCGADGMAQNVYSVLVVADMRAV
jgi:hypothetical protein